MACEDVSGQVSRGCPINVQLETGLGTSLAMGESRFCKTVCDLGQHVHDGLLHCRLKKNECIPMPTGVGHNNRFDDVVSVVQPSDISLADAEFRRPSHGDSSPKHDTSSSIAAVCDHG